MRKHLPLLFAFCALGSCEEVPDEEIGELELAAEVAEGGHSGIWRPRLGTTWDWQLTAPVNTAANVEVYDIDVFSATPAVIDRLHKLGRKVVCYVNVGAWEDWRPDAAKFPAEILGKPWSATKFTDEKWFDIRRLDILGPLLAPRFDMAKSKGCDAVEPDNLDGFEGGGTDRTGFNLTAADQLKFNRFVADEVHRRGMSVALKNDPNQAAELQPDFDFVVSEQCFDYKECDAYKSFTKNGKAILLAEYREDLGVDYQNKFDRMCPELLAKGISAILKKNDLDAWMRACGTKPMDGGVPRQPSDGGVPGIGRGMDAGRSPTTPRDAGRGPVTPVRPRDAGVPPRAPDAGRGPVPPRRAPDAGNVSNPPVSDAGVTTVPSKPVADAGVATVPSEPVADAGVATVPPPPVADAGVATVPPPPVADAGVATVPPAPVADAGVATVPPAPVADAGVATAPPAADAGAATVPSAPVVDAGVTPPPPARVPDAGKESDAGTMVDAGRGTAASVDAGRATTGTGRTPRVPRFPFPPVRPRTPDAGVRDAGRTAPAQPGTR